LAARRHVLVVDPDLQRTFPRAIETRSSRIATTTVDSLPAAVRKLEAAGFDAVFLRVDGPREASRILRVRAAAPHIPLVAVVPEANPDVNALARSSGADRVIEVRGEDRGSRIARAIASTEDLLRQSQAVVSRTRDLAARTGELVARGWALIRSSLDLVRPAVDDFVPLLVEDDPSQAIFLQRVFAKIPLPFPLPVMHDGVEAVAYLAGQGAYGDRREHPFPSLVILDLRLPRMSGLDVLKWIRARAEFEALVVFILTNSTQPEAMDAAIASGADSWFAKPLKLEELADVARLMALRWTLIRRAALRAT
jgi:CheY-like chemotaxis protein